MALKILYNKELGIDTTKFTELSKMVSNFTGIPIPKTHPFVGDNIFTHESGIHVAAIRQYHQSLLEVKEILSLENTVENI